MNEIILNPEYAYIIGVLLGVGGVLKHALPKFPNRFIPLVTIIAGTCAVVWWSGSTDRHVILAGIVISLTATGIHGTTKNMTESKI